MKKQFFKRLAAVQTAALLASGAVMAEIPAAVSTEITTAKTDLMAGGALLIAAGVAFWGLKKLGTKMGWWL